jgi:hypothetical protein
MKITVFLSVLEMKGILVMRKVALNFGCISSTWISKPLFPLLRQRM